MKQIISLIIVVSVSCRNVDGEKRTQKKADLKKTEDSSSIFSSSVIGWINANLKTRNPSLSTEERWQDDSLRQEPFELTKEFTKNYASVLRWSPDSTHILDIGSYGAVLTQDKNGKIYLEYGEPDTEVAMISVKNNQRTRLLYVGPSAEIKDGKWLNNTELMILGTFKSETGKIDTLSWKVDLQEKIFTLYNVSTVSQK
jgi:hypothetical protein